MAGALLRRSGRGRSSADRLRQIGRDLAGKGSPWGLSDTCHRRGRDQRRMSSEDTLVNLRPTHVGPAA